jgi:hypothetical protein
MVPQSPLFQAEVTMFRKAVGVGGALLLLGGAAGAHHASNAFDRTKVILVTGTVKEFRWTSPHSWLYLAVPNGKGGDDEWALEGGSVSAMVRNGWTSQSLRPGQKVKVLVAPRFDGTNSGEYLSVRFEDGSASPDSNRKTSGEWVRKASTDPRG